MAISGQENIRIGAENSPANSDSLYTAFNKAQNNFTKLFQSSSSVNSIESGTGINVATVSNVVTITNTGVTNMVSGTGITLSGSNGTVVVSVSGNASGNLVAGVTSVGLQSNTLSITNSPVISSGIINVELPYIFPDSAEHGNLAGTYTAPTITLDPYGRVVSANSTTSVGTVTSVAISGGTGIQVNDSPITESGTITLTNTGVTRLNAGYGIALTSNTGEITIEAVVSSFGGAAGFAPGGNVAEIQFNDSGVFGAVSNLYWDTATATLNTDNLVVAGNVDVAGVIGGTLSSSAQPNVTSLGSLAGLTVSNATGIVNFTTTANVTLGAVANLHIAGGTANFVLKTDGAGNLSWVAQSSPGGVSGGSNTHVQFNDETALGGSANLTFNKTTGTLTAYLIAGDAGLVSNITAANIVGAIAEATHATYAGTANAVAGANVTGTVRNATNATVAGSANAVAGANVTGTVSFANYATYSGTAAVANAVAAANVSGTVTTANYAAFAGNITIAAQPNITSLGDLVTLNVTDDITAANITALVDIYSGNVTASGNMYATAFFYTSDISMKTSVEDLIDSENVINSLRPVSFTWIASQSNDVGFIAQEVANVIPSSVSTSDGIMTINYAPIIAHLVSVVKDHSKTINTLLDKIAELEK